MQNRCSVKEASEMLGIGINQVRYYMRTGKFNPPIGHVIDGKKMGKKTYLIYRSMLNEYMNTSED